jgi:hypothetical protein
VDSAAQTFYVKLSAGDTLRYLLERCEMKIVLCKPFSPQSKAFIKQMLPTGTVLSSLHKVTRGFSVSRRALLHTFALDVYGALGFTAKQCAQQLPQRHSSMKVSTCKPLMLQIICVEWQSTNPTMTRSRGAPPPPHELAPNVLTTCHLGPLVTVARHASE